MVSSNINAEENSTFKMVLQTHCQVKELHNFKESYHRVQQDLVKSEPLNHLQGAWKGFQNLVYRDTEFNVRSWLFFPAFKLLLSVASQLFIDCFINSRYPLLVKEICI